MYPTALEATNTDAPPAASPPAPSSPVASEATAVQAAPVVLMAQPSSPVMQAAEPVNMQFQQQPQATGPAQAMYAVQYTSPVPMQNPLASYPVPVYAVAQGHQAQQAVYAYPTMGMVQGGATAGPVRQVTMQAQPAQVLPQPLAQQQQSQSGSGTDF